jgi:hypothetical protein
MQCFEPLHYLQRGGDRAGAHHVGIIQTFSDNGNARCYVQIAGS